MTEAEFEALAHRTLNAVETAFETSAPDVGLESTGAGLLEIEFENGAKIIVNRHTAAREIWVAAKSGGFHFRYDGSVWRDTRDGTELFAALSGLASAQGGTTVLLRHGPG